MRLSLSFVAAALFVVAGGPACGNAEDESSAPDGQGPSSRGDDSGVGGSSGGGGAGSGGSDTAETGGSPGATGGAASTGGTPSGSGGSGGGDAGWVLDTSTPYGACLNYLERSCRKRRECEGATEEEELCLYTRWAADWCPDYFFSEGSNTTTDQVNACAAQWSEVSCDDVNKWLTPTCGFPAGDIPTGEPCAFGTQCEGGYCEVGNNDGCGTCGVVGELGQECRGVSPPVRCPIGTECTVDVCVPALEFSLPPGAECERYGQCIEGYFCLENADGSKTCQERLSEGQTCIGYSDCGPGLSCDAETNVCVRNPGEGESCAQSFCGIGLLCNSEQVCEPRPTLGQSCTRFPPDNIQSNCEFDYDCFCQDAACTTGRCFVRRYAGQPCDDGVGECGFGLECTGGVCVETGTQDLFGQSCGQ